MSRLTRLTEDFPINDFRSSVAQEGFDIERFKSVALGNSGVARPNLFLVNFHFSNDMLKGIKSEPSQRLSLLCENTTLPGVHFTTEAIQRYGYGPIEKKPVAAMFNDIPMNFIGDGDGYVLKFFHYWMNFVINFNSGSQGTTMKSSTGPKSSSSESAKPYEVRYKDDFDCEIEIVLFDATSQKFLVTTLTHAYPSALNQTTLSWAEADSYMKIGCMMTYRDWYSTSYTVEEMQGSNFPGQLSRLLNGTSGLISAISHGNVRGAVSAIGRSGALNIAARLAQGNGLFR
jgi:hypothetical protein